MTDPIVYDVVVVGAGIIGSSTAYYLAKHGHKTLLLEQFMLPHTRGSSHGGSRIIRKAYVSTHHAAMMPEAYEMWAQLEREARTQLFKQTGMLVVDKQGSKLVTSMKKALQAINSPYEALDHDEMRRRFPRFHFDASHVGIFDPAAGLLKAQRALTAYQEMFEKFGGTLLDEAKVNDVTPGQIVTVNTTRGQFKGKRVIFTVGPWAKRLTRSMGLELPLKALRIAVCYWKEKGIKHDIESGFPVFMSRVAKHNSICYGLPTDEYEKCLKVCLHKGPEIDPRYRDATDVTWDVEGISEFVREHFPGVEGTPAIVERCIYTMTPDEDFILDSLPGQGNIIIGAGFSGHGFKLAPVVGKILAQMALREKSSYPTTPFRMDRFKQTPGPKSHL